ncbi:MAG: malate dehydrogenase [Methanospirillum sp.]|nr:malate dehydrogenase [Methanospirillum sp.]
MARVAIIGATGNVGSFIPHPISEIPYVDEILLVGRPGRESFLEGLSRDFEDSYAARGTNCRLSWSTDLADLAGSEVIVHTAGAAREAGQARADLAYVNARVVAQAAEKCGEVAPDAKILMVTNPVDVMTAVALRASGMKKIRVFGLGTHLDSMRLKAQIARLYQVHVSEVHTRMIGEHGPSMVPLWSATTVGGIRIDRLPSFQDLPVDRIVETVRAGGETIIRNKGSTVYGPGEAIATLVRTVLGDENRILTVSAYIRSEVHDIGEVCIGVPARLNREGVTPIPIRLDPGEVAAFEASVNRIRAKTALVLERLGLR